MSPNKLTTLGYTPTAVWLLLCLSVIVWRCLIPTQLDWSPTSIHKDFVHIFWGSLVTVAVVYRNRLLGVVAFFLVLFEVAMVLLQRN